MAIDTRDKRASVLSFLMPWDDILPLADNVIDQGDRQHIAHMYRGIPASIIAALLSNSLPSLWMEYLAGQGFTQDGFNSRLRAGFISNASITTDVTLADAMHIYFNQQGISSGTTHDRMLEFLDTNFPTLTGSLTDKLFATLQNNEFFV